MATIRAERWFAKRLQWGIVGPAIALFASAVGGVLVGYEQLAEAGVSATTGALSLESARLLLAGGPGIFIVIGIVIALVVAGLLGLIGSLLEVVGGAIVMTGNPVGIVLVVVGGVFVVFGSFVPWWRYLRP